MALTEEAIKNFTANFSGLDSILASLLVSTIAGGIVFLIVVELIAKKLHDKIGVFRVFLSVFIINIITLPIIWGLSVQTIASIPFASLIIPFLPFLVWLVVIETLFKDMQFSHSFILSIIGYVLSIFVIPTVMIIVRSLLPF